MLKQRVLTSIVLIAIVLSVIFFLPPTAFAIITLIPLLLAAIEWSTLMNLKSRSAKIIYCILLLLVAAGGFVLPISWVFLIALVWWAIAAIWLLCYPKGSNLWGDHWLLPGIVGILVLVPCWLSLNYLKDVGDGPINLLMLLVIVWGMDIGAYFVGRRFGTRRLAATISPNKTVEGFYGGLILSIVAFILLGLLFDSSLLSSLFFASIMLLTAFFSVIGDLFESMVKRIQNKKDSGQLLPGHGGLLDRIDSLAAAAPFFAFGLWVLQLGWQ